MLEHYYYAITNELINRMQINLLYTVCLSVRLRIPKATCPNFTAFSVGLHDTYGRVAIVVWSFLAVSYRDGTAWMTRWMATFGMWHPYTLRVLKGRLVSAARAHRLALQALSIYVAAKG